MIRDADYLRNTIYALELDIFAKKIISLSSLDLGIFLPYLDMVVYGHQIVVMKYVKVITLSQVCYLDSY